MKPKVIIVSRYFNPLCKCNIEYFNNAKANGDKLIVIVNSDDQRAEKGSKEFQNGDKRVFLVSNIKSVDQYFSELINTKPLCNYQAYPSTIFKRLPIGIY